MLVICEECSKKYEVDETRMTSERARFTCYECGNTIVVVKPDTLKDPKKTPAPEPVTKK